MLSFLRLRTKHEDVQLAASKLRQYEYVKQLQLPPFDLTFSGVNYYWHMESEVERLVMKAFRGRFEGIKREILADLELGIEELNQ